MFQGLDLAVERKREWTELVRYEIVERSVCPNLGFRSEQEQQLDKRRSGKRFRRALQKGQNDLLPL
jgi:hypothetical protein